MLELFVDFCVIMAALGTTAIPTVYAFTPWRTRVLGKMFMLNSVLFAMTIDLTAILYIWKLEDTTMALWLRALRFGFIACATAVVAWWIWRLNFQEEKDDGSEARTLG